MKHLFERARALIDIPSVTGSEAEIGVALAMQAERLGLSVEFQTVEGDRRNVLATAGPPAVLLCTHMDTVGPFIASSEDETHLYGRGACDTKGIQAAMLEAAARLVDAGVDGFGLLFVVGEETTSDGAQATASLDLPTRAVIVGEPTGNVLASGHKGSVNAEVTAEGVAGHSGYPERAPSATHRLLEALTALRSADWGVDPVLGPGSLNVGTLDGGVAVNVIAPSARASLSIRVVDSAEAAVGRLESIIAEFDGVDVHVRGASDPVECSTIEGWEAKPVSYGTDLPHLGHLGERYLVGPGSIHDAHTEHERIAKSELVEAVSVYEDLVLRLVGGNDGA